MMNSSRQSVSRSCACSMPVSYDRNLSGGGFVPTRQEFNEHRPADGIYQLDAELVVECIEVEGRGEGLTRGT